MLSVNVTPNGRMSLPADIRKRMGLISGGQILVEETDEGVILRTTAQAVAHAQAFAKRFTGDRDDASVDAFLAARRTESGE
jgi:AbrB family looped-hinge helix DNA binding protein